MVGSGNQFNGFSPAEMSDSHLESFEMPIPSVPASSL